MTVAAFMDLALYDADVGYYARAARRTGRAGDFFTSVDVGPLFGTLLAIQVAEMAARLGDGATSGRAFDLVEAGAANGQLAADILRAIAQRHPDLYALLRLHLVEASAAARAAQRDVLGPTADRLASSSDVLPAAFEGVLIANELLDAFPVHQVVMRDEGLREVYVTSGENDGLTTIEGAPSTPRLAEYLERVGVALEPGARAEINLRAVDWIEDLARRLQRGFVILIDYGHEARELYSPSHASGTLTTFTHHTSRGTEASGDPAWLLNPGEQDITAHVDFTGIQRAAAAAGLETIALLDQTYFLMGLLNASDAKNLENLGNLGNPGNLGNSMRSLRTLLLPGGLGSTMKVLLLGKDVGVPRLRGTSYRVRVT